MSTEANEKEIWNAYFSTANQGAGQESEKSLWWDIADRDCSAVASAALMGRENGEVCEAGCGSGTSTTDLMKRHPALRATLMDISPEALTFAKASAPQGLLPQMSFVEGSIMAMPFPDGRFDLTWNVGLVEHYPLADIARIVKEMARVTKPGGAVVVGIPNRNSSATLKAALLGSAFGHKWLKWAPGYRNTTEILYGNTQLQMFLQGVLGAPVTVSYGGSPLPVGSPHASVAWADKIYPRSPASFLTFFTVRV